MNEQVLLEEQSGSVLKLTLNRPEKYNSLSNDLMERLHDALIRFGKDETQRVCLITGKGKNFCSGADIHAATAAKIYGIPVEEVTSGNYQDYYDKMYGNR